MLIVIAAAMITCLVNFSFLFTFLKTKFIGVILVNKII